MTWKWFSLFLCVLIGCSESSPLAPTPPREDRVPNLPPSFPPVALVSGSVRALIHGYPVDGATVEILDRTAPTGPDGYFSMDLGHIPGETTVTITAPGYLDRETRARLSGNTIFTMIRDAAPFSSHFYQEFARGSQHGPPQALMTWNAGQPNFYIKLTDENGDPIVGLDERAVLTRKIREVVPQFTGGKYQAGEIRMGDEPFGVPGWITIEMEKDLFTTNAGRAFVGANPGRITLNKSPNSLCNNTLCGDVVAHEIGHALGFWHVTGEEHVMFMRSKRSDGQLSEMEQYHARIAYARERGNAAPDRDPSVRMSAIGITYPGISIPCPF